MTFLTYYGKKDQVQNQGAVDEFTFRPTIRRYGVFGNYLFFDKLDVLGGYLRSNDDWQDEPGANVTRFTSNGYRAEVDYYLQRGCALMARYDRLNQNIAGGPANHTRPGMSAVKKPLRNSATSCCAALTATSATKTRLSGLCDGQTLQTRCAGDVVKD